MLLSIVITAYNIEKYIIRAIESVASFDNPDVEIIIIDDGSIDSTSDIVLEYINNKKNNSNIKLVTQKNSGVVLARKKGWDVATGEYILHLDGDDFFLKNSIARIRDLLVEAPDMITFGYERTKNEEIFCSKICKYEVVSDRNIIAQKLFSSSSNNSLCNKCVKRTILEQVDINSYCHIKKGEDRLVLIDCFPILKKIIFDDSILYGYYQRNESIMHTLNIEDKIDFSIKNSLVSNILSDYSLSYETKSIIINNELDLFCMNLRRISKTIDVKTFISICLEYQKNDFYINYLHKGYYKKIPFEKRNYFITYFFRKNRFRLLFFLTNKFKF